MKTDQHTHFEQLHVTTYENITSSYLQVFYWENDKYDQTAND